MPMMRDKTQKRSSVFDSTPLHRPELSHTKLKTKLVQNVQLIKSVVYKSADVVITPFKLFDKRSATIIYIEGLSNISEINKHVIQPLVNPKENKTIHRTKNPDIKQLAEEFITISEWDIVETVGELVKQLMEQHAILIVDGQSKALVVSVADRRERTIGEPDTESLIRGPREGFNENLSGKVVRLVHPAVYRKAHLMCICDIFLLSSSHNGQRGREFPDLDLSNNTAPNIFVRRICSCGVGCT